MADTRLDRHTLGTSYRPHLGNLVCHMDQASRQPHIGLVDSTRRPDGSYHIIWLEIVTRAASQLTWISMEGDLCKWTRLKTWYPRSTLLLTTPSSSYVHPADLSPVDYICGPHMAGQLAFLLTSADRYISRCCYGMRSPLPPTPSAPRCPQLPLAGIWLPDESVSPGITIANADIQDLIMEGGRLVGCSDGSVSGDHLTGSYGWIIAIQICQSHTDIPVPGVDLIPVAVGSGLCNARDNYVIGPLTSTRMESIGIVAGLEAWQRICTFEDLEGLHVDWICDNQAAVDVYHAHVHLNAREWQKLNDKDVWGYLDSWLTRATRTPTTMNCLR